MDRQTVELSSGLLTGSHLSDLRLLFNRVGLEAERRGLLGRNGEVVKPSSDLHERSAIQEASPRP